MSRRPMGNGALLVALIPETTEFNPVHARTFDNVDFTTVMMHPEINMATIALAARSRPRQVHGDMKKKV